MHIFADFQTINMAALVEMNPASIGRLAHAANNFFVPMRKIEVISDGVPPKTVNLVIHQCSDRRVRQYCANLGSPAVLQQQHISGKHHSYMCGHGVIGNRMAVLTEMQIRFADFEENLNAPASPI